MATQPKKRATSIFIDNQVTGGQDLIDNPNANLDKSTSNATYDIVSQVIYSFSGALENTDNVTNEEPIVDIEDDAEAMPADSTSVQNHASLALNSEQTGDTSTDSDSPIDNAYDDPPSPDNSSDVENNTTDAPVENLDSGSDQATVRADLIGEPVVLNVEPDFYFSSGSILTNDSISFDSFTIASGNYMANLDTSFVLDAEQSNAPINIEDTVNNTSADNSLTDDIDFFELIDDSAVPVEETVTEEPFIIDDASYYDEFINEEYNPDEIVNGNSDQINDPVTDEDFIGIDLVEEDFEVIEETTDNLFDDLMEEPVEDYETPNDVIDESIDNNTEPFIIYSSFTTHYGSVWTVSPPVVLIAPETLELKEGADLTLTLAIDDNRINNLTVDDTSIYAQEEIASRYGITGVLAIVDDISIEPQTEVASDDLAIIGLPASTDWII